MKIKSLLAAVSMVAISASSASALTIIGGPGVAAPGGAAVNAAGLNFANSGDVLACELDQATSSVPGLYGFAIVRGNGMTAPSAAGFNTGVNTVTITLPGNRTFTSDATGLSITSDDRVTPVTAGTTGSVGNVTAGGTAGANSVTFTIDITNNGDDILIVPPLPISSSGEPMGPLTVSVIANGAPTDGGPASDADVFAANGALMTPAQVFTGCQQALTASAVDRDDLAPGLAGSNTQVALAAPIYTTLSESGANNLGTLGTVNLNRAANVPFVSLLNSMGNVATVPFSFANNVASVSFNVVPSRGTAGIATATLQNGLTNTMIAGGTSVRSATGFAFTVPYSAPLSTGPADSIVVSAFPPGPTAAPILSQDVSVQNYMINLRNTPGVVLFSAVPGTNGALDALDRVGQNFGPFDWNGSEGTNSVYRITNLPPGTTTGTATFTNDVNGSNGTFPFSVTSTNGEAVLSSFGDFGTTNSGYRRADVALSFELAGQTIDVDRLLSRNGIISDFGAGANFDVFGAAAGPNNDQDDNSGTE